MTYYDKLSIALVILALFNLGTDLSTWASNTAIIFAILHTYNPPPEKENLQN